MHEQKSLSDVQDLLTECSYKVDLVRASMTSDDLRDNYAAGGAAFVLSDVEDALQQANNVIEELKGKTILDHPGAMS